MSVSYISKPLKHNTLSSYQAPGVGEAAHSMIESQSGTEPDGASVNNKSRGIQTAFGKIVLNESDSGATIEIENAKATIAISKSGHLDIHSSSGSGVAITATAGKVVLNAVDVMIKSNGSMSIDSGGDLNLSSKGAINLTTPTGAINMTSQAMEQNINGLYALNVTKEMNTLIGGHMRTTVGGNHRQQITGFSYYDVGEALKFRSGSELVLNSSDSLNFFAKENSSINTKGNLDVRSDGTTKLTSGEDINITGSGDIGLSSGGAATFYSAGVMAMDFSEMHMDMGEAESIETTTSQAPEQAQVVDAETIQDELSTVRQSPSYAYNGKGRTNSGTGRMRNRGSSSSGTSKFGENPNANIGDVDGRLANIYSCAKSKFEAQTGYRVGLVSGYRPGDPRFHGQGKAIDVAIYDKSGNQFDNYQDGMTNESFRVYEAFAHQAKACQEENYPGLPLRWGGYFWNGGRGNYGAMDPMHLDIGGVSTAGGNWKDGASYRQLSEWGLSADATRPYNGTPNYDGTGATATKVAGIVGNPGVESGAGGGDQYQKFIGTEAEKESKANQSGDPKNRE